MGSGNGGEVELCNYEKEKYWNIGIKEWRNIGIVGSWDIELTEVGYFE